MQNWLTATCRSKIATDRFLLSGQLTRWPVAFGPASFMRDLRAG
jgi:hypothetical protein